MNISQKTFLATSWIDGITYPYRRFEIMPFVLPVGLRIFPTLSIDKTSYYNSTRDDSTSGYTVVVFNTTCSNPIGKVYGASSTPPLLPKFSFIVF